MPLSHVHGAANTALVACVCRPTTNDEPARASEPEDVVGRGRTYRWQKNSGLAPLASVVSDGKNLYMELLYGDSRVAMIKVEHRACVCASEPVLSVQALSDGVARLAYVPFDRSDTKAGRLAYALALAGSAPPTWFNDPAAQRRAYSTMRIDGLALLAFRSSHLDKIIDIAIELKIIIRDKPLDPDHVYGSFRNAALALMPPIQPYLAGLEGSAQPVAAVRPQAGRRHYYASGATHRRRTLHHRLAASGLAITRTLNHRDPVAQLPSLQMHYRQAGCNIYTCVQGDGHEGPRVADSDANLTLVEIPTQLVALLSLVLPRALTNHTVAKYLRTFWPAP